MFVTIVRHKGTKTNKTGSCEPVVLFMKLTCDFPQVDHVFCPSTLQNSVAQLPVEELDRIQEYLQTSGLAQR